MNRTWLRLTSSLSVIAEPRGNQWSNELAMTFSSKISGVTRELTTYVYALQHEGNPTIHLQRTIVITEKLDDLVPIRAPPRWLTGNCERHFKNPLMHLTTAIAAAVTQSCRIRAALRTCWSKVKKKFLVYHFTMKEIAK